MHLKTILLFSVFLIFFDLSAGGVAKREIARNRRHSDTNNENVTLEPVPSNPLIKSREKRALPLFAGLFALFKSKAFIAFFTGLFGGTAYGASKAASEGIVGMHFSGPKKISSDDVCRESSELKHAYENLASIKENFWVGKDGCQKFNDYIKKENANIKKNIWPAKITPYGENGDSQQYETFGDIYSKFFTANKVDFDDLFCPSRKSSLEWWLKNEKNWSTNEAVLIQEEFVERMKGFLRVTREMFDQISDFDGDCDSFDKNDDKYEIDYDDYILDEDYDGSGYEYIGSGDYYE